MSTVARQLSDTLVVGLIFLLAVSRRRMPIMPRTFSGRWSILLMSSRVHET